MGGCRSSNGTAGRVDANLWFLICCGEYWRANGDDEFLANHIEAHEQVRFLLGAWEFNNRGLLYIPITDDWADEYLQNGYFMLLPAFHPVITPTDDDWEDLQMTFSYTFKNHPHEYHNGGLWPNATYFGHHFGHYPPSGRHEIVHLIEMLLWGKSSCSQPRFNSITLRFFGHTTNKHGLITPKERAFVKFGVRPGAKVRFRFDGIEHTGVVNRVSKRATVLVEDHRGQQYSNGKLYRKFYVPVQCLQQLVPVENLDRPFSRQDSRSAGHVPQRIVIRRVYRLPVLRGEYSDR